MLFTRNANTGARELFGEYLIKAQGEDVVAGIRTPNPIKQLASEMPAVYTELLRNVDILEVRPRKFSLCHAIFCASLFFF